MMMATPTPASAEPSWDQRASTGGLDLRPGSKVYRRAVTGYRISEAAELSGPSRSSLRFYEKVGVLQQPDRTPGGYRAYTPSDLDRLRFLARTRDLGLRLDEVRDLLAVWDGGTCASAQARLHDLVAAKIESVDQRIAEFGRLRAELQRARDALAVTPSSDKCGADCTCMTATARTGTASTNAAGPVDVQVLTSRPGADQPAISCTLGAADLHDRLRDWQEVLLTATALVVAAAAGTTTSVTGVLGTTGSVIAAVLAVALLGAAVLTAARSRRRRRSPQPVDLPFPGVPLP